MNTYTIQATPQARERLEAYFNEIVDRRKAGELGDVSQYASRWCEQAARLAITLHAGLYGANAHQYSLTLETADNAVRLAKWFADQQLGLLTNGRRTAAKKVEETVLELLDDRTHGRRLEPEERATGLRIDYVTARTVIRNRIVATADAARALLVRMEGDGLLVGEDVQPAHGGKVTRIFRAPGGTNPVPG